MWMWIDHRSARVNDWGHRRALYRHLMPNMHRGSRHNPPTWAQSHLDMHQHQCIANTQAKTPFSPAITLIHNKRFTQIYGLHCRQIIAFIIVVNLFNYLLTFVAHFN